MRITKDKSEDSMNLREQAEKRAKQPIVEFRKQRGEDTAELIHELRVHQIELEIQNEELRNAQFHPGYPCVSRRSHDPNAASGAL